MTRPNGLLTPENTTLEGHVVEAVLVDGVKVDNVAQCHTEEGWADVLRVDEDGHFFIVDNAPDTDRIHGVVTVTWAV